MGLSWLIFKSLSTVDVENHHELLSGYGSSSSSLAKNEEWILWNFLQRSMETFNRTGYVEELYQYFIWKVQMLNCHYSTVCFLLPLFHMARVYTHILLKLSFHKNFWDLYSFCNLWICFNLLCNWLFGKSHEYLLLAQRSFTFQPRYVFTCGVHRSLEFIFSYPGNT